MDIALSHISYALNQFVLIEQCTFPQTQSEPRALRSSRRNIAIFPSQKSHAGIFWFLWLKSAENRKREKFTPTPKLA